MKQFLKDLWGRINGNKSIIIGYVGYLLGMDVVIEYLDPQFMDVIKALIPWLGGGALVHHGVKGGFRKDTK